MYRRPAVKVEPLDDLHFGVVSTCTINFGDEIGSIATDPRFEVPMNELLDRLDLMEGLVRRMSHLLPGPRGREIMLSTEQADLLREIMADSAS